MPEILELLGISMTTAIAAVVVVVLLVVLYFVFGRRRSGGKTPPPTLVINLTELPQMGPMPVGPKLQLYGVPMRLAVLVVAPSGRGEAPPDHDLATIVNEIVPGLKQVIESQKTLCRGWPGQLSAEGFTNTFFTNIRLPGDKGKGTPWCAVAGRGTSSGQKFLIGMALRAAAPNAYGQTLVNQESQWVDLLRTPTMRVSRQ